LRRHALRLLHDERALSQRSHDGDSMRPGCGASSPADAIFTPVQQRVKGMTGDWVLGRRPAPFVVDQPQAFRPDLLVLLDAGVDRMIALEVMEPGGGTSDITAWAMGKLRRGIRLRVENGELAEALRLQVREGIEILVAPTPEIDSAIDAFVAWSDHARGGGGREPDWVDGAGADAKAGFYTAAAQFERSRPWRKASDGQVLAIDVPALGCEGACLSILGKLEDSFGLLLLRSIEDYAAFARLAAAAAGASRRGLSAGVPLFSVNFDRPRDLPAGKKLAAEARAHGFVPGPGGRVPYILKLSPDAVAIPTTTDDYRLATACLEAARRFVEKHGELFAAAPSQRVEERSTVVMPSGALDVVVTAPPRDLPWRWGEQEPIEGVHERDREAMLAAFHAARAAGGASPEEADAARWAAQEMLEFKARLGGSLVDWTPDDVDAYLLQYYPSHGSETGELLRAIPDLLDAFLGWLAMRESAVPGRIEAARKRIAQCREAFLREASDPRRFGPAKAVVQAMRQANVDVTDPAAVEGFMEQFNRRLQDDPSLLPMAPPGTRWVWDGEGPPPDPRGACPCGSGRRYRKCCMPR